MFRLEALNWIYIYALLMGLCAATQGLCPELPTPLTAVASWLLCSAPPAPAGALGCQRAP